MKMHLIHILILALILAIGGFAFFSIQGSHGLQLLIGILTVLAYVCWGILHHAFRHDLHPRIVVEYVLIGALALVLLLIVLVS